jgi:hypothetical protein
MAIGKETILEKAKKIAESKGKNFSGPNGYPSKVFPAMN